MEKRYVTVAAPVHGPVRGDERVWTEVTFSVEDLARMIGLAPGTGLVSMTINREHTHMTWTFEEPREALWDGELSSRGSGGGCPTGPPGSSTS